MDIIKAQEHLTRLGLTATAQCTGCPMWVRLHVFVPDNNPNSLGLKIARFSFKEDKLWNDNWHLRQTPRSPLCDSDYYIYAWQLLSTSGYFISKGDWVALCDIAEEQRQADLVELQTARAKLTPKKRKAITGRCVRRYIEQILEEIVDV